MQFTFAATPGLAIYNYSDFSPTGAGSRLFEIESVWYDDQELDPRTMDEMRSENNRWLFDGPSSPLYWIQWGDQQIRIYYPPGGTANIDITGWVLPDPESFDDDTDVPALNMQNIEMIPIAAAIRFTEGLVSQENNLRFQYYQSKYAQKLIKARSRLMGSKVHIFGGGSRAGRTLNINRTVFPA
jgi:hypothetical protein